jgi:hypothetical protein
MTQRISAISGFVLPRATHARICCSRAVRPSSSTVSARSRALPARSIVRRRGPPPTRPRRAPEVGEVRLERLEDVPVAFGEVPPGAAVEQERLRVPRRRGNGDVELVLDSVRPEPHGVDVRAVQLRERHEVGKLERAELPGVVTSADRMLGGDFPVRHIGPVGVVVFRNADRQAETLPDPVLLAVRHPVGRDQLPQLHEHVLRERLVTADFGGVGDEAKHVLRIACGEARHGPSKDTTNDEWTPEAILDNPSLNSYGGENPCASSQSR